MLVASREDPTRVPCPGTISGMLFFSYAKKPFYQRGIDVSKMSLKRKNTQKHLELYLDVKLNFSDHINEKISIIK